MSTSLLLFIQHPCIDIPWLNFQMPQPSFPCPKRPYSILTTTRPGSEHGQHTSGTSSKPMSWSPMLEVILANMKNRKTCTSGYLYKSPHTQTKNNAVQVYYTYIYIYMYAIPGHDSFIYFCERLPKKMIFYFLWGPHLIVSRNFLTVPRCKSIVDPIRTRKWIHLVQYPTPGAAGIWILNLKMYGWMKIQASSSIIEKCKQYTSITLR